MKTLNIKIFLFSVSIASIIAAIITCFSNLPFWGALLIVIAAMAINGFIAEKEDLAPGCFLNSHGCTPQWPVTVSFEDGSKEQYKNEKDLECNLEFFNSKRDVNCTVTDSAGKELYLVLDNLEIKELKYKE